MEKSSPVSSIICTSLQKEVVQKITSSVEASEPCSIVGIVDMGKHNIFQEISYYYINLEHKSAMHSVVCHNVSNVDEQFSMFEELRKLITTKPILSIVRIVGFDNRNTIFEEFHKLRDLYGTKFMSIVFSDLASSYQSYIFHSKHLLRGLIIHPVANYPDYLRMIEYFESQFGCQTSDEVQKRIYNLSGGGAGLIKSLFLLTKTHDLLNMSDEEIMQDTSIQYRLEALKNDIPEPIRNRLEANLPLEDEDKMFLTLFGVLKEDGSLFSPLLEEYMDVTRDPLSFVAQSCTSAEMGIIKLFQTNIDKSISRDQIAQSLWGADWEDKYSDWAIDQAIHRLRSKLRDSASPYSIHTKKGVGFMLRKG